MDTIAEIVNELAREYYEYLSKQETDYTEQERQIAVLAARTKQLQAHTELAQEYFAGQMKEREKLFRLASEALEKAMETGDVEIAQIAVITMENVHKKSPFSD